MTVKDQTDQTVKKIKMSDVPSYLNVSHRVVERLVREGTIEWTPDPLDGRRRLVSIELLDKLKVSSVNGVNSEG